MRSRRAVSLIELMVWSALASLTLLLAVVAMTPSLKWMVRHTEQSALHTMALSAMTHLVADLQTTAPAGAARATGSGRTRLWLTPQVGLTPEATTVWDSRVVLYYWDSTRRRLHRKEWPPAPPDLGLTPGPTYPVPMTASQAEQVVDQSNGTERSLARDVLNFDVSAGPDGGLQSLTTVRLVLETVIQDHPLRVSLARSVLLRNPGNYQ